MLAIKSKLNRETTWIAKYFIQVVYGIEYEQSYGILKQIKPQKSNICPDPIEKAIGNLNIQKLNFNCANLCFWGLKLCFYIAQH